MHSPIQIRPAVCADVDAVTSLIAGLDEHHRRARPDVFRQPVGPRREPSWLDAMLEGNDRAILVANKPVRGVVG